MRWNLVFEVEFLTSTSVSLLVLAKNRSSDIRIERKGYKNWEALSLCQLP